MDEDTLRPSALAPAPQAALAVASEDATDSVEALAAAEAVEASVEDAIAVLVVVVVAASAAVVVAATADSANKTATALLLMLQQVLATVAVIETGIEMVLAVGMTVVVAHMMTGLDATAADMAATATDAVAVAVAAMPTTNLSVATEEAVTSTSLETTTDSIAENAASTEDTRTRASYDVIKGISWWWVSFVFTLTSIPYPTFLLPLITKGKQG